MRSRCLGSSGPRSSVLMHNGEQKKNLKRSSRRVTEEALLGIFWPKKHSGNVRRVGRFPSFQTPGHHQLPLALPAGPPHVIASATFSSLAPALAGRVAALRALRNQPNHLHLLVYFTRSTAGALLATAAEGDWR